MTLGLVYWILMLLWAVFGVFPLFPREAGKAWYPFGGHLLLFILLVLLGWHSFGAPIHG